MSWQYLQALSEAQDSVPDMEDKQLGSACLEANEDDYMALEREAIERYEHEKENRQFV